MCLYVVYQGSDLERLDSFSYTLRFSFPSFLLQKMSLRTTVLVLILALVAPPLAGKQLGSVDHKLHRTYLPVPTAPPENEMGLLHPPSFTDLTWNDFRARRPESRSDVGLLVGRRVAVGTGNMTMSILNASTTNLADGSWIAVQVDNPNAAGKTPAELERQWVGVFPAAIPVNETVPIEYTLATVDPSYAQAGVFTFTFRVINVRVALDIVFFDACTISRYSSRYNQNITDCVASLRVGPLVFADDNEPLRPAVLVTDDPTAVLVAWTSASRPTAQAFVEYRLLSSRPQKLRQTLDSTSEVSYSRINASSAAPYSRDDLCGAPATTFGYFDPGVRHLARLAGLQPGSWYAYRFGDTSGSVISDEYSLWLPPAADPTANVTLFCFGDLGRGTQDGTKTWSDYGAPALNTSRRLAEYLQTERVDGLFHIGDLSYATGYLSIWDTYAEMMTSTLAHLVYGVIVGNHETDVPVSQTPPNRVVTLFNGTDSGGECSVPTNGWYPMPWKSIDTPWFSYNVGPVHICGMSTEHDFFVGSEQYAWIANDLRSVDRSKTPWIIFGGHRPMYIDSTYGEGWSSDGVVMDMLIDNIEPLLLEARVDVAVWGHNHVMQRFCLLRNRSCTQHSHMEQDAAAGGQVSVFDVREYSGVLHLVLGAAGAAFTRNVHMPWLPMTENAFYEFGYGRFTVQGNETLLWQWLDNEQPAGMVRDAVLLQRRAPPGDRSDTSSHLAAIVGGAVGGSVAVLVIGWVALKKFILSRESYAQVEEPKESLTRF
jgi:hypothetical protein